MPNPLFDHGRTEKNAKPERSILPGKRYGSLIRHDTRGREQCAVFMFAHTSDGLVDLGL